MEVEVHSPCKCQMSQNTCADSGVSVIVQTNGVVIVDFL
jgi:hypothetical protein